MTIAFIRTPHLVDFHQESFDHVFLHAGGLPEHSLGMDVEMKVARLDDAESPSFLHGLAFGGLAVRQAGVCRSLGESPLVTAVGINQKELDRRAAPAITDRRYLQRQGLRDSS